jgi:hypothetical protein
MRATLLPLFVLSLAACSEQDRLMGKAWSCQPNEEMHLSMSFLKDNKLEAKLDLSEPKAPQAAGAPARQPMSIKMNLGGQWVQPEEGRMDFAFRTATVTEAKRGDTPMSDSDVFFYKEMFEASPKTSTKIIDLSGNKFTYQELSSDKKVTCTR